MKSREDVANIEIRVKQQLKAAQDNQKFVKMETKTRRAISNLRKAIVPTSSQDAAEIDALFNKIETDFFKK